MKTKQVGLISVTILFSSTLLLVAVEKIIVGPSAKEAIDIEASVEDNLLKITKRLNREIENLLVAVEKSDFTEKFFLGFEKSHGVPHSMSTINKRFRQGSQEGEFGRGRRGPRSQEGEFGRIKTPKIGNREIGKNHFGN